METLLLLLANLAVWPAALDEVIEPVVSGGLEAGVPGAVVVVVDEDGPILMEGYGAEEAGTDREVDPESTRFPVASVSKPVTAAVALSMHHDGSLDLDADLTAATGIQLMGDAGEITLRHVLTHTAGFDDPLFVYPSAAGEPPWELETWFVEHPPIVDRAPGTGRQYSPLAGYGLIGLAMERADGTRFDEVMAQRLFEPLGMSATDFDDVSLRGPNDVPVHYTTFGGDLQVSPLPPSPERPAASLWSTGADMAALLTEIVGGGGQALDSEVVDEMLTAAYRPPQGTGGHSQAFVENAYHGTRVMEHAGGNGLAWIAVLEDAGLGVFVGTNSMDSQAIEISQGVVDAVAEHLGPGDEDPRRWPELIPEWVSSPWQPEQPSGTYQEQMASLHTPEALLRHMSEARISPDGENLQWGDRTLQPQGERWCDKQGCVAGRVDPDTGQHFLLRSDRADMQQTLVRVPWYRTLPATSAVVVPAVGLALAGLVAWVRRERRARRSAGPPPRLARFAAIWSLGTLVVLVGLPTALAVPLLVDPLSWLETDSLVFRLLSAAGWISAAGAAGSLVEVWHGWNARSTPNRVKGALLLVTALSTTGLFWVWNVL